MLQIVLIIPLRIKLMPLFVVPHTLVNIGQDLKLDDQECEPPRKAQSC